jgi:putative hydrolase of the HAD superfamily
MQKAQSSQNGKLSIRGVIFDYGNVLCYGQRVSDLEGMAQVCGIAMPHFRELYWKFRVPYDRSDLNAESYWQTVAGEKGLALSDEQITKLVELDTQGWARLNPKTMKWVEQLHGAGLRVGLLSNMPSELSRYLVAKASWVSWFHHLTFSCDMRMVKPDPAIYKACLESLAVAPGEVLFLDDLAHNVEAAAKLGIHSVLFDDIESTTARVAEQFDVPIPDFAKADAAR